MGAGDDGMSQAITKHTENGGLDAMMRTASMLRQAGGMIPKHLRSDGEILAVIMAGQELGLGPMASLRGIYLIHGKVGMDYATMIGLLRRHGYRIEWLEKSSAVAHLKLTHPDGSEHSERWDVERAKSARLWGQKGPWSQYPEAMLTARCVSSAARAFAGDVLAGCYSLDEVREVSGGSVTAHDAGGEISVTVVDERGANESHGYHNPEHDEARQRALAVADGFVAKHLDALGECINAAAADTSEQDDEDDLNAIRAGHESAIRSWISEHGAEYLAAVNAHPACGNAKGKIFRRLRNWSKEAGLSPALPGELLAAMSREMEAAQ